MFRVSFYPITVSPLSARTSFFTKILYCDNRCQKSAKNNLDVWGRIFFAIFITLQILLEWAFSLEQLYIITHEMSLAIGKPKIHVTEETWYW